MEYTEAQRQIFRNAWEAYVEVRKEFPRVRPTQIIAPCGKLDPSALDRLVQSRHITFEVGGINGSREYPPFDGYVLTLQGERIARTMFE